MVCSNIKINKSMLAAMVAVSFVIIVGSVEMDHFLDKQNTSLPKVGLVLTVAGYILFSVLASVSQKTHKFDHTLFLKRGLPALLVGAVVVVSQRLNSKPGFYSTLAGFGLSVASWGLLSSMLVYTTTTHRRERLWLYYGGATLINGSLIALFLNRKYNMLKGTWDGPQNVFGMGLPMLTMGWMCISAGMSLC